MRYTLTVAIKTVLLLSLISVTGLRARAGDNYYFRCINVENGLSQNTINSIIQDRRGFMWFATKDGLNRYDGKDIRIYMHSNSDPESLRNDYVNSLYEDSAGKIWVGTDFGVDIFLPQKDRFVHIPVQNDKNGRNGHSVTVITEDTSRHIWIAVEGRGVFKLDIEGNLISFFSCNDFPELSQVSSILFDNMGLMWLTSSNGGLYYSADSMDSLHPFIDNQGKEFFKGDPVSCVIEAPFNCLILGSLKKGIWELNLTSREIRPILLEDADGFPVRCRKLMMNSSTQLFAGTESGLFIYNVIDGNYSHFKYSFDNPYSLSATSVYSLCKDAEGGVWIGTYFGGVNYCSPAYGSFNFYYPQDKSGLKGKRIREICPDNMERLWVGTEDGGLHIFNPVTGKFHFFEESISFNNIHGMCLCDGLLWVGTIARGVKVVNPRTERIVRNYENSGDQRPLLDNDIYSIFVTRDKRLFLGTRSGLMLYSPRSDSFEEIAEMKGMHIYDIKEDIHGNLWVATYSNGAWCFKASDGSWHQYLHDNLNRNSLPYDMVISIYIDSHQDVWLTTHGGGCCRYREASDDFEVFSSETGLPNNVIYQIIEDDSHNYWMTSNKGLICYSMGDPQSISVYTSDNGLLYNQFNYKSGYKSDDGRIYFGSIDGLMSFYPQSQKKNSYHPILSITDFNLPGYDSRPGDDESPLQNSIEYTEQLILKSKQNTFSFKIVAPSYVSTGDAIIRYRLEDYDSEWEKCPRNTIISYSNLKYGDYTFRAIYGEDGTGDELSMNIEIKPPFYLSVWAHCFYLLLAAVTLFVVYASIKRKNLAKARMMKQELEQEKERAIYESKINFFTDIAHEIRTPLSLINGPLEYVLDHSELQDETREELDIMKQNTERLINLTSQLLDFKKMENQKYNLSFIKCNVSDIVRKNFVRFTTLARQKNISFRLDCVGDDIFAWIDKEAYTKVLSNLLNNGLKYAESFLTITLKMKDGGEGFFQLITENDGNIIPASKKEDIFKPFVRLQNNNRSNSVPGTGIGLSFARSLANMHNGTLELVPGESTNVFVLTMPIEQEKRFSFAENSESDFMEGISIDNPLSDTENGETVLIVEDNAEMRSFLVKTMSKSFNVLSAHNGEDAFIQLENKDVNLIISDIVMPVMDGIQLCKKIKDDVRYSHIPVILLSAKTNDQSKIEGMEMGADLYIEKPFSIKYLQACVHNVLEARERLLKLFIQSSSPNPSITGLSKKDNQFIERVNEIIEANYSDSEFSMEEMAEELNMSRSSFYRKITAVLKMSPNDYLKLVRLKKASVMLTQMDTRVSEVCYMVGFNSPSYFAKCFQKQFGITPQEYRKEHSQTID